MMYHYVCSAKMKIILINWLWLVCVLHRNYFISAINDTHFDNTSLRQKHFANLYEQESVEIALVGILSVFIGYRVLSPSMQVNSKIKIFKLQTKGPL